MLGNMGMVRAFGATWHEHGRFDMYLSREMGARRTSLRYLEKLRLLHASVTVLLSAGLLGWILGLWSAGRTTTGDVVLVSSLGFAILHGTRDLAVALVDVTQHVARLAEALETLLVPHGLHELENAKPLEIRDWAAGIDFEDVTFAYAGRRPVLDGFTLHIRAGERVGLVGPSGAGKSTVLALLQHFYEPQHGVIRIAGQDVSKVTLDTLHATISTVPQDVSLFHRSLLENLRYGRPEATEEQIRAACNDAFCTDLIASLPGGLHTVVGDRGDEAIWRPAAAHRDCPCHYQGYADPAAGRSDIVAGQRIGNRHPDRPRTADAWAHGGRHCSPDLNTPEV